MHFFGDLSNDEGNDETINHEDEAEGLFALD